jgi:hypothetical protein
MRKSWEAMTREERLSSLRSGSEAGQTITEMALRYSTSRGAISGALQRAGISVDKRQGRPALTKEELLERRRLRREKENRDNRRVVTTAFNMFARNPDKTRARADKEARQRAIEGAQEERAAVAKLGRWEPLPGSTPRPLGGLHMKRDCTWPLWTDNGLDENNEAVPDTDPHVFCGEPCPDRNYPYCKTHMRMAFRVMPVLSHPYEEAHEETEEREVSVAAE